MIRALVEATCPLSLILSQFCSSDSHAWGRLSLRRCFNVEGWLGSLFGLSSAKRSHAPPPRSINEQPGSRSRGDVMRAISTEYPPKMYDFIREEPNFREGVRRAARSHPGFVDSQGAVNASSSGTTAAYELAISLYEKQPAHQQTFDRRLVSTYVLGTLRTIARVAFFFYVVDDHRQYLNQSATKSQRFNNNNNSNNKSNNYLGSNDANVLSILSPSLTTRVFTCDSLIDKIVLRYGEQRARRGKLYLTAWKLERTIKTTPD